MAYTRSYPTWKGNGDTTTPITPASLQNIEDGIVAAYVQGAGTLTTTDFSSDISGHEYAYAEFTSNVSITGTTEAGANTVVTAGAVTFDGSTVIVVEFFCPRLDIGTTNISIALYDGSSSIGLWGPEIEPGTGSPVTVKRRYTPNASTKTFSIRCYVDGGTGTAVAGAGGLGVTMPGYIRVTKA